MLGARRSPRLQPSFRGNIDHLPFALRSKSYRSLQNLVSRSSSSAPKSSKGFGGKLRLNRRRRTQRHQNCAESTKFPKHRHNPFVHLLSNRSGTHILPISARCACHKRGRLERSATRPSPPSGLSFPPDGPRLRCQINQSQGEVSVQPPTNVLSC